MNNENIDFSFLKGESETDERITIAASESMVSIGVVLDDDDSIAITISAADALRVASRLYAAGRAANGQLPGATKQRLN